MPVAEDGDDMPENVIPIHAKKKRKGFTPSLRIVGQILREAPELGSGTMLKLNEFSGELLLMRPVPRPDVPFQGKFVVRPLEEVDVIHLIEFLDAYGGGPKISATMVEKAVLAEGHRNKFSAPREKLNALPAWDGTPRIEAFWVDVCGAAKAEPGMSEREIIDRARYLEAIGRCFFIGVIARILDPGCKVDASVILEGPQGSFKSTLLRVLAFDEEAWFSDSMVPDLRNKDARGHLKGKMFIEMGEVSQFRSTQVQELKRFLSAQDDKYRPPYGKIDVTFKRQCTFVGTTNETGYLIDTTGNRRFWPIKCGVINIVKARELMPQLYAEAISRYYAKEPWHLDREIEEIAEREQRERMPDDPWQSKAMDVVREKRMSAKGSYAFVTTSDVLHAVGMPTERHDDGGSKRVATILVKLGGTHSKRRIDGVPKWGFTFELKSETDGTGGNTWNG